MRVKVLYFGPLAERLARREEWLEVPDEATAEDLYERYRQLGAVGRDFLLAVNEEFATSQHRLHEGDEIALLPPMSGGSPAAAEASPGSAGVAPAPCRSWVELARQPLEAALWRQRVSRPEHGAVAVFEGVVRDHHRGKPVSALAYEAYEPMARRRLEAIAAQALAQWPIGAIAVAHRLGRLEVGEVSVVVAVGAAHREAAFAACRFAIEALKRSVPIWKKEWSPDGAAWSEGALPAAEDGVTGPWR